MRSKSTARVTTMTIDGKLANFKELTDLAQKALSPWERKEVSRLFFPHRHHLTRTTIFGHVAIVMWEGGDVERGHYWRAAFRLSPGETICSYSYDGKNPDKFFYGPEESDDYAREQADAILRERGFVLYDE